MNKLQKRTNNITEVMKTNLAHTSTILRQGALDDNGETVPQIGEAGQYPGTLTGREVALTSCNRTETANLLVGQRAITSPEICQHLVSVLACLWIKYKPLKIIELVSSNQI